MKENRTGNESDRGRSGRAQRRNDAKRRAEAESGTSAAPESPTTGPEASYRQAAANGADSGVADDGGPAHRTADDNAAGRHRPGAPDTAAADQHGPHAESESDRIAELTARVTQLQDDLLRKQADFENARKRLIRDKEEAIKFANAALLVDLTGVLDDFERAISAAAEGRDFGTLHSGIELIEKQLLATLERKWGLARFDSAGQPFDPERHEALATQPSNEHREATVLDDYQKGYTLHGRVVRAARVRVATPLPEAGSSVSASGDRPNHQPDSDDSE